MIRKKVVFIQPGKYYNYPLRIESLSTKELEIMDTSMKFLPISDLAAGIITAERKKGNTVLISKEIIDNEVNFNDLYIISNKDYKEIETMDTTKKSDDEDEEEFKERVFEKIKADYLQKALELKMPTVTLDKVLRVYDYIEIWGRLFNKGYVITEENKEDIYIDIIEKDDEELLNLLERLLNIKSNFEEFRVQNENYINLVEEFDFMFYDDFESFDEAVQALRNKFLEITEIDPELVKDVGKFDIEEK